MGSGGIASSWDGTISESEFRSAAAAFADRWKIAESLLPPWLWVPLDEQLRWLSRQVDGFLSLENVCLARSVEDPADGDATAEESDPCGRDEPFDDATLVQRVGSETDVHHYDFHIIYSHSYRVPVLYFRVYSSDGQPLALSDFKRDLPSDSIHAVVKSKWTFITQEEHPYLKRPWHKLHPCGTSEWVKLLLLSDTSVATRNDAIAANPPSDTSLSPHIAWYLSNLPACLSDHSLAWLLRVRSRWIWLIGFLLVGPFIRIVK